MVILDDMQLFLGPSVHIVPSCIIKLQIYVITILYLHLYMVESIAHSLITNKSNQVVESLIQIMV